MKSGRMVFVVKDNKNHYVGVNSIQYDRNDYIYSDHITNGFLTYTIKNQAETVRIKLQQKANELKANKVFKIDEIDLYEVLKNESVLKFKKLPFIHETLGLAITIA